jgi:protein-tyrosine phosphatase
VNLYLGQEITYQDNMISLLKKDALCSVNHSLYILLELPFQSEVEDFDEVVFSCRVLGYTIILAHPERYDRLSYDQLIAMRSCGVLFQINSNSITGANGKTIQKRAFRMFKDGMADLVGSDVHYFRPNDMDIAYSIISEKFGKKTADDVFMFNARNFFNIK